jgi:hypothetical protein
VGRIRRARLGGGSVSGESTTSGLGRYADGDPDESMHTVTLVRLPVRVMDAGRRHHDELMHEFAVLAVADDLSDDFPQRMLALIDTLGRQYGSAGEPRNAQVDAAMSRGDDTIDLTYEVPQHVVQAADNLAALMAEADEFCEREQMLTLQRSDVVREFSEWYLDEFRRQINGEPPRPWNGPLDP